MTEYYLTPWGPKLAKDVAALPDAFDVPEARGDVGAWLRPTHSEGGYIQ